MRLDWWMIRILGQAKPVEESEVYRFGDNDRVRVLVESQGEYELASALQYIHGSEINLTVWDRTPLYEILLHTPRLYITWDPADPNRL